MPNDRRKRSAAGDLGVANPFGTTVFGGGKDKAELARRQRRTPGQTSAELAAANRRRAREMAAKKRRAAAANR